MGERGRATGRRWATVVAAAVLGVAIGLAGYTFVYARGYSYLVDDPMACGNCHVMREQVEGWQHGSHRAVATCNDCHTPHGFFGKYATKALNGWNHSLKFTTGGFHEPIRANARNRRIAQESCAKCHAQLISGMGEAAHGEAMSCVRCHGAVGHPGPQTGGGAGDR